MTPKTKVSVVSVNPTTHDTVFSIIQLQAGIDYLGRHNTLESIKAARPDVVLVDGHDASTIEFCERILIQSPKTKIVLMSNSSEEHHINRAIGAGITGVVLNQSLATDVPKAINAVSKGHYYLSAEIADAVVAFYRNTPGR
jgi:DNA-binding NarL/FixJ family response regulator